MDLYIAKGMPKLYTERLVLRRISKKDIRDIYEYSRLGESTKYLLWYPHLSIKDTKRNVKRLLKKYKKGSLYDYAVVLKDNGKMIGTCGFSRIEPLDDKAEIGYVINPSFQKNGYATEAVRRLIRFGFEELGLERIEARYIIGNDASCELMKRVNMTYEGVLRHAVLAKGKHRDVGVFSILSNEYYKSVSKIK